jgi:hypothetical protein
MSTTWQGLDSSECQASSGFTTCRKWVQQTNVSQSSKEDNMKHLKERVEWQGSIGIPGGPT